MRLKGCARFNAQVQVTLLEQFLASYSKNKTLSLQVYHSRLRPHSSEHSIPQRGFLTPEHTQCILLVKHHARHVATDRHPCNRLANQTRCNISL